MYDSIVGIHLESLKIAIGEKRPPPPPPPIRPQEVPIRKAAPPAPTVPLREAPGKKAAPPQPPPYRQEKSIL